MAHKLLETHARKDVKDITVVIVRDASSENLQQFHWCNECNIQIEIGSTKPTTTFLASNKKLLGAPGIATRSKGHHY